MRGRAILLAALLLPLPAAAQSISSSGALGEGFIIVPLVLWLMLGLPGTIAYLLLGRWLLGRWPRWWAALVPLLAGAPLGVWLILLALDGSALWMLPIMAEGALIGVMIAIGRQRDRRQPPG